MIRLGLSFILVFTRTKVCWQTLILSIDIHLVPKIFGPIYIGEKMFSDTRKPDDIFPISEDASFKFRNWSFLFFGII